jgi:6-hydroxy-3-succinoylpyridine 3-monooxygenase
MFTPAPPTIATKPGDRVIVYIDGFNLYYGAVRDVPRLKWLNIERFCRNLRPADDIQLIRYFSAMVTGPTRPNQEVYLRALGTLGSVKVILGRFKNKQVRCGVGGCSHTAQKLFQIPEEKRTDVNIAVSMVDDAYQNQCDHLVLISGDSDLVPAVAVIRERFPEKRVTVYIPCRNPTRGAAVELRAVATRHRDLPLLLLERSQFPDSFPDGAGGTLTRPAAWH